MTDAAAAPMLSGRDVRRHHRDADEEALQAALQESLQPDFMAEILAAESSEQGAAVTGVSPSGSSSRADDRREPETSPPVPSPMVHRLTLRRQSSGDLDEGLLESPLNATDGESNDDDEEDEDEDVNAHHPLLNVPEHLLLDILHHLDEDSVGHCLGVCRRLRHVTKSADVVFETLCRRIFPVQCPRVAAARDRFALRKFPTWLDMLEHRPRVRHGGFYFLKTFYYKKPELNMWSEIQPGTILQVVYYRYFAFQRDGTVLYAMIFRPPHEAGAVLRAEKKGVWRGTFQVDRDEVFVSVPTNHNVVEFRFRIGHEGRGRHVKLTLLEHYSFSEPDRTGWVDQFETAEEELRFYRQWDL